jgi:hypothetical protein
MLSLLESIKFFLSVQTLIWKRIFWCPAQRTAQLRKAIPDSKVEKKSLLTDVCVVGGFFSWS